MLFNLAFDNALYLFLSQVQAWGVRRAIAGEGEGWRVVCGLSTPGETSPTVFCFHNTPRFSGALVPDKLARHPAHVVDCHDAENASQVRCRRRGALVWGCVYLLCVLVLFRFDLLAFRVHVCTLVAVMVGGCSHDWWRLCCLARAGCLGMTRQRLVQYLRGRKRCRQHPRC